MRWLVFLILGLSSLAQAHEARACSCMKLTPSEGLSSSHAVFAGEVIQIAPNQATRFGGLEITFRVRQVWKGEPSEEIRVHTAGTGAACGYAFAMGVTYLVYALRDEADPMRVSLCGRTAPIENAKEDLHFLGKPAHRFDDPSAGRKGDRCSASPGRTGGPGFGFWALVFVGLTLSIRRRSRFLAIAALGCSFLGCGGAPPKPALMADMAKDDVAVTQLRAIDYEYAAQFGQLVSVCVIDILGKTDDPRVRDRAYQWRMWAGPQAREAAFDQDPFAGFLGLWVLAGQQRRYFADGAGQTDFETQQGCALETSKRLENRVEDIAATVVGPDHYPTMAANVHDWVANHSRIASKRRPRPWWSR